MPTGKAVRPLQVHEPVGCHLQAISNVGGCFNWGGGGEEFDRLMQRNHGVGHDNKDADPEDYQYLGRHFTATIVSIRYGQEGTQKELKKRGFVLLGIQPGAHGGYKMELWGHGFTIPAKE
jgi:hypothetical protein